MKTLREYWEADRGLVVFVGLVGTVLVTAVGMLLYVVLYAVLLQHLAAPRVRRNAERYARAYANSALFQAPTHPPRPRVISCSGYPAAGGGVPCTIFAEWPVSVVCAETVFWETDTACHLSPREVLTAR
jgi:hypothetical protein